jgi:hypothetical protein
MEGFSNEWSYLRLRWADRNSKVADVEKELKSLIGLRYYWPAQIVKKSYIMNGFALTENIGKVMMQS